MNIQLPIAMDKAAFLSWAQHQEGHYELAGGRVVMMVGASRAHGIIVRNLLIALHGQLNPTEWTVLTEFGLDTGPDTLRYPDILVDRAGGAGTDYTASAPAVVAEVLSPSTETTDLGDKAAEYLKLPSLLAYLIIAQDRYRAWLWTRGASQMAAAPEVIVGSDKIMRISALNLLLPMAAIYAGVEIRQ